MRDSKISYASINKKNHAPAYDKQNIFKQKKRMITLVSNTENSKIFTSSKKIQNPLCQQNISKNNFLIAAPSQNLFKEFSLKKAKYQEFIELKKQKKTCYQKLALRLKEDLKQLDDHDNENAKEKLTLLDKCMKHKHCRNKNNSKGNITIAMPFYQSAKNSRVATQTGYNTPQHKKKRCLMPSDGTMKMVQTKKHRLKSAICLRNSVIPDIRVQTQYDQFKTQNLKKNQDNPLQKQITCISNIQNAINKIQKECASQVGQSQNLKQQFSVVEFYQKMIFRNTNYIMKKIL